VTGAATVLYVTKPFGLEELLERLVRILG